MTRYEVEFTDGHQRRIDADWYTPMGDFIRFFVRRPDGGGQTVARIPRAEVATVRQLEGG